MTSCVVEELWLNRSEKSARIAPLQLQAITRASGDPIKAQGHLCQRFTSPQKNVIP